MIGLNAPYHGQGSRLGAGPGLPCWSPPTTPGLGKVERNRLSERLPGVGTRLATACLMVAILVTASCGASQGVSRAGDESPEMSPQQSGTWKKISKAPDGSSEPEGTFWIMNRLVVVAGSTIEAWVPERDEWKVVAEIPQAEQCEGCGYSETVVWTGEDLLLWVGGFSYRAPTVAGRSSGRRGKAG